MPTDVTSLLGLNEGEFQIPVTLVAIDLPGAANAVDRPRYLTTLDVPLFLNRATGAASFYPQTGYTRFDHCPDMKAPRIEKSDSIIQATTELVVPNRDEEWDFVLAAGTYRRALFTVWQGQLSVTIGASPDTATFPNPITYYVGRVDKITTVDDAATLAVEPHSVPFSITIPYLFFTAQEFPHAPKPGDKRRFGYTEKTL